MCEVDRGISRLSPCHGAVDGIVVGTQRGTCAWHCGEGGETPHRMKTQCHAVAGVAGQVGSGGDARPLPPFLNGCHGVWLHSDCSMMDYDYGGPFSACEAQNPPRQSMIGRGEEVGLCVAMRMSLCVCVCMPVRLWVGSGGRREEGVA